MARRKLTKDEREELNVVNPDKASKEEMSDFLQEIWDISNVHGPVIGAIIQINLNMLQETTIFFSDGFTSVSEVPLIGYDIEEHPEYKYNLLATKRLLAAIFCLGTEVEGDYVCRRGTPQELEEHQSYGLTCYFVFRPPEEGVVDFNKCLGIWQLDEQIRIIAEDEGSEFMPEVGAVEV